MPRLLLLLLVLALMPLMASCASSQSKPASPLPALSPPSSAPTQATSATEKFVPCSSVKVVLLSVTDSLPTVSATIANNAAIRAACGDGR